MTTDRRRNDRALVLLLAIVLIVQLLQGLELHDRVFDVDAAADEIITGLPKYTEAGKEITEFVLVGIGLVVAVRQLLGGGRRKRRDQ